MRRGDRSDPGDPASRHQLFEDARRSGDWTVEQLWTYYLALGGTLVAFDIEGYLVGLMPMPAGEQNVLACALKERLSGLSSTTRVPYVAELPGNDAENDAWRALLRGLPWPDPRTGS